MMHILSKSCFYVLQKGVLKVLLQISVNVLQEVRPVLRNPDTSDEQILIATQRASIEKREKSSYFPVKRRKYTFFRVIIVLAVLLVLNKMIMNSVQISKISYFLNLQVPSLKLTNN